VYLVDAANGFHTPFVSIFGADGSFVSRFGAPGDGGGEFVDGGGNAGPQGLAVSPAEGSVFVSEGRNFGHARVQKFDADGNFLRAWGWGVADGSSEFQVCTVAESCLGGIVGSGAGQFGSATTNRVAVDPVAPHHVFVSDPGNRRVQEFTPAGGFVRAMGWGVRDGSNAFQTCTTASGCQAGLSTSGSEPGRFGFLQPVHLTVGTDRVLYASDSNASNRVQRIDLDAVSDAAMPMAPIGGNGPLLDAVTSGLAFDTATDNLLVARDPSASTAETVVQEIDDPAGTPVVVANHASGEGWTGASLSDAVAAITVNSKSGDVYVARPNVGEVSILNLAAAPTATLEDTLDVTAHTATLKATVDPNGGRTRYTFQYRPVGASEWSTVAGTIPRSDTVTQLSEPVTNLVPDTPYEVQLLIDGYGAPFTVGTGPAGDFSTPAIPPTITQRDAAPITETTARLQAKINPNNRPTSYHFEWGPSTSYGNKIPVPEGVIDGNDPIVVTELITGLQPGITYHFRIVADNGIAGPPSDDQTFTTKTKSPCEPNCDLARGYELVSPADKFGGIGVGFWYEDVGAMASSGVAAHAAERFIATANYGSVLHGDAGFSYANELSFAERASDHTGWRSHSPITHTNLAPSLAQTVDLYATSETMNTNVLSANQTLGIWPEIVGGDDSANDRLGWQRLNNGFLVSWGGPFDHPVSRWELFGPTSLDSIPDSTTTLELWSYQLSGDGAVAVAQTKLKNGLPTVHGVAGPGDPTWPSPANPKTPGVPEFGDLVAGRSIYMGDLSDGPADSFEGTGARELVNVCTGSGPMRTSLPAVGADDKLGESACAEPGVGRDHRLVSSHGAAFDHGDTVPTDAVSVDGSRIFFVSPDPPRLGGAVPTAGCTGAGEGALCPPQLYVRQRNADRSVAVRWISKAEDGLFGKQDASLAAQVSFEGATPDGKSVFFRTSSPLTTDDPNGAGSPVAGGVKTGTPHPDSWDLYRYDLPDDPAADPADGELTRISAGPDGTGDCNSPVPSLVGGIDQGDVGALRFASDDGSRVYFTCAAPLPGVGEPGNGTITAAGGTPTTTDKTNLYLYDENLPEGEQWRFVTRLPRGTGASLNTCASTGTIARSPFMAQRLPPVTTPAVSGSHCVRGTQDGAFVTFFTTGTLTADDPATPTTGDIYGYDADADQLTRITAPRGGVEETYSCSGDNPATGVDESLPRCFGDGGVDSQASIGSSMGRFSLGVATDPLVEGDRVAFFQSRSRLVAGDTDDAYDVYQWRNGKLSLVTSGDSDTAGALYKGNDRTGRNVYFVTRDQYSWQDFDAVADVYTARVGGGIPEQAPPPSCGAIVGGCQDASGDTVVVPPQRTRTPGGRNVLPGDRSRRLSVRRPGARALRRAARSGVLRLRVGVGRPGRVRVVVRGRVHLAGGRVVRRVVGVRRVRPQRPGVSVVGVRLNRLGVRELRRRGRLVLLVRVDARGADSKRLRLVLRGRAGR
jgi:hypothetical protein